MPVRDRGRGAKEKGGNVPVQLLPVVIAKWVGGIGPHDVRRWPEWSAMHALMLMRAEAAT